MSRLGDMIFKERTQRGLTAKQVAKKSGVSEKFILEVEGGGRIIADDAARRILKAMGKEGELVSDFEAMASGVASPQPSRPAPAVKQEKKEPAAPNDAWLDAMGGILKRVPVLDAAGKEIGSRMLPTENAKIHGAPPEKVFFLQCGDNSMRGYRLRAGDRLLVIPAAAPADGATMVIAENGQRVARRVTRQDNGRVLLQWFDAEPQSKVQPEKDVQWLGRAVLCEFSL